MTMSRCRDIQRQSDIGALSVVSPSEHYATVSLELEDRGDETELRMECRGVPAGEEDSTREGWTRFYFHAIKQTFGY